MKRQEKASVRGSKLRTEPSEFQRRLGAYSLSAAAAGVAVVACSVNVEAAPICKPSSVTVFQQSVPVNPAGLRISPFELADTFNNVSSISGFAWNRGFFTPNAPLAGALLAANNLPANLAPGASIGPGGRFGEGREYGLLFTYGPLGGGTKTQHKGNFDFSQDNYFGFKFAISGQIHYGWVRLAVTFGHNLDGIATAIDILEYAYESNPNTAILAGACSYTHSPTGGTDKARGASPASLGMLARGASALSMWRR